MTKKLFALCALLLFAVATPAKAGVLRDGNNRFDFLNWETFGVDGMTIGELDVGDTLRGVLQVQNASLGLTGTAAVPLIGTGNPSITGIFEVEVIDRVEVVPGSGIYYYEFGVHDDFATRNGLNSGAAIAFYYDDGAGAQDFDNSLATHGANEATVTNGTLLGDFGFSTGLEYWYTGAVTPDVPPPSPGVSTFKYGLSYLGGGLMSATIILPQVNPFVGPDDTILPGNPGAALGILPNLASAHDLVGKGQVAAIPPDESLPLYDVFSNDPALIRLIVTPEPSSMILLGLGLAGIGGVGLRRRRKTELAA